MSDVSPTTLRGLLVPDPRLTYVAAYSTNSILTEQGPMPGVPVAVNESEMVLEAGGAQAAATTMHIQARSGGHPRTEGATFSWRYSTDPTTDGRGWEPPTTISAFEAINYSTTANQWTEHQIIRKENDGLLAVTLKTRRFIRGWTKPPDSTTWTERTIYDTGATVAAVASPCVLQLPGGRVLLFHWDEVSATVNQVRMHYSDDGGAVWTMGQSACLLTPLNRVLYTPTRLRCAYLNGEIMLLAGVLDISGLASRDRLIQYASDDLGATFSEVSMTPGYVTAGDQNSRAFGELTVIGGRLMATYLKIRTSAFGNRVPFRRFVGQAYESLAGAPEDIAVQTGNVMEWGTISGTAFFTGGELATWLDEDGVAWMAGDDFTDLHTYYCQRSTDQGLTWAMIGTGSAAGFGAAWWNGRDASTHPKNIAGCAHQGRAVILHNAAANPGTADDSLFAVYLGGYTSVTLPNLQGEAFSVKQRAAWERTWLPYDLPQDLGGLWNRVAGGVPVTILDAATLLYTGGVGDSVAYNTAAAPAGSIVEGVTVMVDGLCSTTSSTGGAVVDVCVGDGASAYMVRVRFSNHGIILRNMFGSVDIATLTDSLATTAGGGGLQVLIQVYNPAGGGAGNTGRCVAWFRKAIPGTFSDRKWTLIGSSDALTTSAAFNSSVAFGALNGVATTARFKAVCFTSDDFAGKPLYNFSNPADLLGRTFSPTLAYVDGGLRLRMVDGPAFTGDTATISTDYSYPIRNIFPEISPSPLQGWRSVDTASDVYIQLNQDLLINQDTEFLGGSVGVYLGNINFEYCELQAAVAGGVFATIGTLSAKTGQAAMGFTRQGNELTTSAAYPGLNSVHWYTYQTLRNSYVKLIDSSPQGSTKVRKILHNSEGAWRPSGTKRARLILEGVTSSDPLGNSATSTCEFWSKDLLFVINDMTPYLSYRLRIPAQTTYETDFRIGTLTIGHVAFFGQQYSRGRILGTEPNTEIVTARSGARRVSNRGIARRSVQFGWVEGVDTSATGTSPTEPVPNFVSASAGGVAEAAPSDAAYKVAGLADALRGAFTPVVYIPKFLRPGAANVDTTLVNRNQFLYSRLVTGVQLESILGNESSSPGEVLTVGTVTLEEEV